ncbi:MAG: hypothetical protein WB764_21710 [Xanthobacteraceae bacterium]
MTTPWRDLGFRKKQARTAQTLANVKTRHLQGLCPAHLNEGLPGYFGGVFRAKSMDSRIPSAAQSNKLGDKQRGRRIGFLSANQPLNNMLGNNIRYAQDSVWPRLQFEDTQKNHPQSEMSTVIPMIHSDSSDYLNPCQ